MAKSREKIIEIIEEAGYRVERQIFQCFWVHLLFVINLLLDLFSRALAYVAFVEIYSTHDFLYLCLKPVQINIRLKLTAQRACRLSGKHEQVLSFLSTSGGHNHFTYLYHIWKTAMQSEISYKRCDECGSVMCDYISIRTLPEACC